MGWCSATEIFDEIVGELLKQKKQDGLKELAWMFGQYQKAFSAFPTSVEDFIEDRPSWSKAKLSTLIERANKTADRILSDEPYSSVEKTIKNLIEALEGMDWDCESDSAYYNHPLVRKIFKEMYPQWFEDEEDE